MAVDRMKRVNELLRREIGQVLIRVLGNADVDVSAFMITHVITSRNLRTARVLVSIRDHQDERDKMLSLLKRHRVEIQGQISKHVVLKYTPKLAFELDSSVETGDRILDVLAKMEEDEESMLNGGPDDGQ